MKTLLLALGLVSTQAFAQINDFECQFNGRNNEQVLVEVERSYGPSSKSVNVTLNGNGQTEQFHYFTTARLNTMTNRIEFWGAGMDLEINLWPDARPRYGRRYMSNFRSFDVNNGYYFYNVYCQYVGF